MKNIHDTPLMRQHAEIKQRYPDAVLLFRVGDFYETFGEDAVRASAVLGITLTKRNNGAASSLELAGFPHHALDNYLHKLVKAGFRVAICDQLEDPKLAKGIVKRGVTEMVTPGLTTNDKLLEGSSNNFLASVHFGEHQCGVSFLDISTGEFFVAEGDDEYVEKLLQSFKPAEVLCQKGSQQHFSQSFGKKLHTQFIDPWVFDYRYAQESLLKHFQTNSLKGFGVDEMREAVVAAGVALHYLEETIHPHCGHITSLQRIERSDYLWMDQFTIRNLELVTASSEQGRSLLKAIDATVSPMGGRLFRRWIMMPLVNIQEINQRLDFVENALANTDALQQFRELIGQCGDLERLAAKLPSGRINPREVLQMARSLELIDRVKSLLNSIDQSYANRLAHQLDPCRDLVLRINEVIAADAPLQIQKGGVIAQGIHQELDQYRSLAAGGKNILVEIQQREALATGISSLKIGYNNVYGYYLEVSHTHRSKVPETWIRKQTLTNAERYITPELKEYEEKILGAEEKIIALELSIYEELLSLIRNHLVALQQNAYAIACLDCLFSFAFTARKYGYAKPVLHEGEELMIHESRHPVIEQLLPPGEAYVPNDLSLDQEKCQIIILTGPNMSGKSALLRQTALIVLMAHMGSFVPATTARIPLTDKIFTRVGASDNLSGGESTFMVEMNETASIINNVSSKCLIILDEIGRGTSTYDGISIAASIAEYLHDLKERPKTLFATHYHELNELESRLPRIRNYHITHREVDNRILFLRKLAPGGSLHSFGIHVARMAGMPNALVHRATQLLAQLESKSAKHPTDATVSSRLQLTIFDAHTEVFEEIRALLEKTDINALTPIEALVMLGEIKKRIG
jgi:DNA mismatch repair protein MutS